MNNTYSTKNITIGGISCALIIVSLFAGTVIGNSRLFFLALATFFGALPCIYGGVKGGIMVYAASAVLSFIVLPNKLYAGVYTLLGMYPVIKLVLERYTRVKELMLKYVWFNIIAAAAYFIYKNLIYFGNFLKQPFGIILIILAVQILFFIYDYVFTVFITFMKDKFLKEV